MEYSLHYKLRDCHTNCQRAIVRDIQERASLSPGEPKILEFLAEHEPCEQKWIAQGCNLDSASVTGILRRMEERKLIKRENRNGNRRSLYVSLTELGRKMETEVEKTFEAVDGQALEGLSEQEQRELLRLLDVVSRNLTPAAKEEL